MREISLMTLPSKTTLPQLIEGYQNKIQSLFKKAPWFSEENESKVLNHMNTFLNSEKEPFKRSCQKGHFTASCLLVNPKTNKFVLTHHRKLGLWLQLGGHCDGIEDLAHVAMKEAEEESGLTELSFLTFPFLQEEILPVDFDIHTIPESKKDPEHLHLDVRFLIKTTSEDLLISEESLDLKWFTKEEAKLVTDEESLLRLIEKYEYLNAFSKTDK